MEEKSNYDEVAQEDSRHKRLFTLAEWAEKVSWAIVVVRVLDAFLELAFQYTISIPIKDWGSFGVLPVLSPLFNFVVSLVYTGFLYIILQTIAEIVYLLIDIRKFVAPEAAKMGMTS